MQQRARESLPSPSSHSPKPGPPPPCQLPVAAFQALPSSLWKSIIPPSYPSPHAPTFPLTWGGRIRFLTQIPVEFF